MKFFYLLLLLFFISCSSTKTIQKTSYPSFENHISAIKNQYAPDARTVLFAVEQKENVLRGETNLPEAKTSLVKRLRDAGVSFIDSVDVLPAVNLTGKNFAVVNISVANLRTQPRHAAELATQATLGTPLKVLKKNSSWYLVQTPDKYLSWVDAGGIQLLDSSTFTNWQSRNKVIYTQPFGFVTDISNRENKISDIVLGSVLEVTQKYENSYEVKFPDGRRGIVLASEVLPYKDWALSRKATEENFIKASKELMGVPYLWGGTSFKGVDCSGFTKTIYFMNGLVLPRDASQQVMIGTEIDTKSGWNKLRPGDLLFFGTPAKDGKTERVVHVAMWIGNGEFIHASGRVQVASLVPGAHNFDASEHKRFLRAKRITNTTALADLTKTALYELK